MTKVIHNQKIAEITTLHDHGSVAILMDAFVHVDMSRYKDEVVVKLLNIRPAFKREA